MLIVFEGINNVGKTTLINQVEKDLTDQGFIVNRLKYPTSEYWAKRELQEDEIGKPLYDIVMDYQMKSALDIYNNFPRGMTLSAITITLVDRWIYSNKAYTYAMAMKASHRNVYTACTAVQRIEGMLRELPPIPEPTLTFYLHCFERVLRERFARSTPPSIKGIEIDLPFLEDVEMGFKRQLEFHKFIPISTHNSVDYLSSFVVDKILNTKQVTQ